MRKCHVGQDRSVIVEKRQWTRPSSRPRGADDSGDDNVDHNPAPRAPCEAGLALDRMLEEGLRASGARRVAGPKSFCPNWPDSVPILIYHFILSEARNASQTFRVVSPDVVPGGKETPRDRVSLLRQKGTTQVPAVVLASSNASSRNR